MTDTEDPVQRASRNRNRRGEPWDEAHDRIHRESPSTLGGEHEIAWPKGIPLLGLMRLVGDIGTVGVTWGGVGSGRGGRGGHERREHTAEVLAETIQTVFREGVGVGLGDYDPREWTNDPFVEAFACLRGERTLMQLSRRTEITKHRLHRLANGTYPPTLDEMEAIARTFSKAPWYFREYRSTAISGMVFEHMDQHPEFSGAMMIAAMVLEHMDQHPDRAVDLARELVP